MHIWCSILIRYGGNVFWVEYGQKKYNSLTWVKWPKFHITAPTRRNLGFLMRGNPHFTFTSWFSSGRLEGQFDINSEFFLPRRRLDLFQLSTPGYISGKAAAQRPDIRSAIVQQLLKNLYSCYWIVTFKMYTPFTNENEALDLISDSWVQTTNKIFIGINGCQNVHNYFKKQATSKMHVNCFAKSTNELIEFQKCVTWWKKMKSGLRR